MEIHRSISQTVIPVWIPIQESYSYTQCIDNTLSEFTIWTLFFFCFFLSCLFAIYDALYILFETGRWWWCLSCSCPAVQTSVVKSLSISSPWACLWVEAVPARLKIKPLSHLLHFTVFWHVFTFHFSLSQTAAEGLMLGSVAVWVFVSKDESPTDADSFPQ